VAGPPRDLPETLVSMAPGPLVHGVTLGEMARYANARRRPPARLSVVPMRGWRRSMTWRETGRAWVPPSPNLRTPETVLAYPGVCLLEGTNVSEGRGTEAPFLLAGAPWVDGARLARDVRAPGFALVAARFTPRAQPAAPAPKWRDASCAGVRVHVSDARAADAYALGLSLLTTLRTAPDFALLEDGQALDRLLGTRTLRSALVEGRSESAIARMSDATVSAWKRDRRPALLY
jgi:uncharacterized protein YbbC (DUF1343 family)